LEVFPAALPPDTAARVYWSLALISGLLFFASILVHELAHSVVAKALGIPVKGITLFIFGGVAQITKEATRPLAEFAMAVVGPASSLLLAAVFFLLYVFVDFSRAPSINVMWEWLWLMNLGVAVFNMAPGFPMDGGRVLRSIVWGLTGDFRRATLLASWCGRGMAYLLMFVGITSATGVLPWLSTESGVWFVLLGFFLEGAARQSWQQLKLLEFLREHKVADVMSTTQLAVPAGADLQSVVPAGLDIRRLYFLVSDGQRVVGVLSGNELKAVPQARWQTVTAGEAMLPSDRVRVVSPDADTASVLQAMEGDDTRELPVVADGRLVGTVSREAIIGLLTAHKLLR
jgi:Zn-dependent protease